MSSESDYESSVSDDDFEWPEEEHDNVLKALHVLITLIYKNYHYLGRNRPFRPVNTPMEIVSEFSDSNDSMDSDSTTPQRESAAPSPTLPLLRGESLNEYETKDVVYKTLKHFFDLKNDEHLDDKIDYIAERLYPTLGTNETEDISPERRNRRVVVVRYLMGKEYENGPPDMSGGKKKSNRILPQLKPVMMKNKKYTYKLNDPPSLRHKAINEGIRYENKHMNKTKKQAAISKKGRFNILRIYRRNNNLKECNILTKDMEYMDKKYKLGKTSKICSKKKGKNSKKKKSSMRKTKKKKKISKRKSLKRN